MSAFHLPINEIKYNHIEALCKSEITEGTRIEFKRQFPGNKMVAKVISSFANTYGGLFFVGIDSVDRKPVFPFTGEDFKEGLEEKITSICLNSINPPVIPQIAIIQFPEDTSKCIILIRVEESTQTPHRVENDTEIYVRANSQSTPVKANYTEIEWLLNRRQKAEKNKERLLHRASVRFNRFSNDLTTKHFRNVYIIPCFPSKILFSMQYFLELLFRVKFRVYENSFPYNYSSPITQNESFIFTHEFKNEANKIEDIKYIEIGQFGSIWNKETFWEKTTYGQENKIRSINVMAQLFLTCFVASRIFEKIGYWGSLEIGHSMNGILNKPVDPYNARSLLDDECSTKIFTNVFDLKAKRDNIVNELFRRFLWSTNNRQFAEQSVSHSEMLETIKAELR